MSLDTEPRVATSTHTSQTPRIRGPRRRLLWALAVIPFLVGLVWLGLRIQPRQLPEPALQPGRTDVVALPDGLPAPVERFYRTLYGHQVPMVDSAAYIRADGP